MRPIPAGFAVLGLLVPARSRRRCVAGLGADRLRQRDPLRQRGADADEGVEIAGPAVTDLTGWALVAYNGNGGAPYATVDLSSASIPDHGNGYGAVWIPIAGLQNGSPDGIALVDGHRHRRAVPQLRGDVRGRRRRRPTA